MSDDYDPPLVHLPGTRLTPEVVLHRTLNKVKRIKAVMLVIQWDDDSFDTDYSQMSFATMCMGSMLLDGRVRRAIFGEDMDSRVMPPTRTPPPDEPA